MLSDPKLADFVEKASSAGISAESMAKVLTTRGWSEKETYDALAAHYHQLTGVEVPRRGGAAASAKDAFFYLLIFSTLATWAVAFGCLAFALIDRWIADPLFAGYQQRFDTDTITGSLAALIVAFPLYLLISRAVAAETAQHPEKLDSSIRKWLTYMALVVAACVFMGDLIAVLTQLLRGEFTSRFVWKSLVVLLLSGGVLYHYFTGLRRTDPTQLSQGGSRLISIVSSTLVALLVVLGFWQLGSPGTQRELRADSTRVRQLSQLTFQIKGYWSSHTSQLPSNLDPFTGSGFLDPVTRQPYEYRPGKDSHYQLCATFARSSRQQEAASEQNIWNHPAGHACFKLDATLTPAYPVYSPMQ